MNPAYSQPRPFKFAHILSLINDGLRLLRRTIIHSKSVQDESIDGICRDLDDRSPAILVYGIRAIGRIMSVVNPLGGGHILDLQLNLHLSQLYAISVYSIAFSTLVVAIFSSRYFFKFAIQVALPRLVGQVSSFLTITFQSGEMIFASAGLLSFCWLTYHREYLSNFLYYECSYVMIPKSFQIQTAVSIFFLAYCLHWLDVPLFVALTLHDEIRQSRVFGNLSATQFIILKSLIIIIMTLATSIISAMHQLIPCMSCYLSRSIELFIEMSSEKLLLRTSSDATLKSEPEESIKMAKLVQDYQIISIYDDWPDIKLDSTMKLYELANLESRTLETLQPLSLRSELISIHTSLSMVLTKLKLAIRNYQRVFGHMHIMIVCINVLVLAQRILISIVHARVTDGNLVSSKVLTPFNIRISASLMSLAVVNWITFRHFIGLPERMLRLKNQLFERNIQCMLSAEKDDSQADVEVDLLWSYYDKMDTLCDEVCFKFTTSTYYSKGCLIRVGVQAISFIIFYVQIFDLFSVY